MISDAANKEQVWKDITNSKSTYSDAQKEALMAGFWVQEQLDLVRPYFDKYFDMITTIESENGFKFLQHFT